MSKFGGRGKKGRMDDCFGQRLPTKALSTLCTSLEISCLGQCLAQTLCPLGYLSKGWLYLPCLSGSPEGLLFFSSLLLRTHVLDFTISFTYNLSYFKISFKHMHLRIQPSSTLSHLPFLQEQEWGLSLLPSLMWEVESDTSWNRKFCLFASLSPCEIYILTRMPYCWKTVLKMVSNYSILLSH